MTMLGGTALVLAVVAAVRGVWSPCGLSMVSAINPFSEASRGNRYGLTALWFVIGAALGGLLYGTLGAVGALLVGLLPAAPVVLVALGAAVCLVGVLSDLPGVPLRLPLHPRQVNERWLSRYRRWVYASGFGAQIGAGFATYIMTAAVYVVPVLGALTGSPLLALAFGLVFGLVRGSAVLISAGAGDPDRLRGLHRRLAAVAPWSLRAAIAAQLVAAVVLAGGALGAFAGLVVIVLAGGALALGTRRRPAGAPEQVAAEPATVRVPA
ncbi:hypothetical protein [Nakamurella leprariae]|uniref:Sulfite exporter TauE/SafE family protein n=1 Tax=Nakamurella leprariae TaxID=2803911 RepID=A0A938YID0_9ACTN|nr:hypothetical protein [Nakamurella leprariae]MBM9468704.1 hypothetical protein [Nakamurella leprariae]